MGWLRVALTGLIALGVGVLGLAVASLGIISQWGRVRPVLDIATHFAPIWLATALVVLGYGLWLAPRGWLVAFVTLGTVGGIAWASQIVPEYLRPMSPRGKTDAPHQIKLIQFNTWGRNQDPEGTARWIVAQDPDIIVMEEVEAPMRRAMLAAYPYHLACGTCSVAIFSKQRPLASDIPETPWTGPRAPMARATYRLAGETFSVIGVHYSWPTTGRLQQAQGQRLAAVLDTFPESHLIVAGDFNSTPWSFARRREDKVFGLERRTRAVFSWPAGRISRYRVLAPFPILPIDHVYAGSAWQTLEVRRGPRLGSDHYPVVVSLALKRQTPPSRK